MPQPPEARPSLVSCAVLASTHSEYKSSFERIELWRARFQIIDVDEPSIEEAINIPHGVTPLMKSHGISYDEDAVEEAARLAATHILNQNQIRRLMYSMRLVPLSSCRD